VATVVQTLQHYADERQHQVSLESPLAPVWVEGDPTRLQQAVTNLLNNAVKFTESGGRISVAVEQAEEQAVIRVRDTGPGIPRALLPRIFDVFVQGEQGLARSRGGLGIGLTVVKTVAELHGGSVEARSEGPGTGAEFIIRLPVSTAGPAPRQPAEPNGAVASGNGGRRARVLVVDDSPDAAASLAELVEAWGHEAEAVQSGRDALEAAPAFAPDLILLDIGMPGMNGYEVARELREEQGYAGRIIALTGYGHDEHRRRAFAAGCDHHLTKPVDPNALLELLEETGGSSVPLDRSMELARQS
jgi:two-component system CheB/CheR fusion protein